MADTKRDQLIELLDHIDQLPEAKEEFLNNPIAVINNKLGLGLDDHISRTPVANKLLIAALKSDKITADLQETTAQYQAGKIDLSQARSDMAKALILGAEPGSEDWLKALLDSVRPPVDLTLGDGLPEREIFDPQAIAIANIAAAVDIVVVVTEAAVVNSEAFFSGRGRNDAMDIRRVARTLGREG